MFGCIICDSFSFRHICQNCLDGALAPSLFKRNIDGFSVFSFYKYSEIAPLIRYKHKIAGSFILSQLAKNSFKHFAKSFEFSEKISVIAIDDNTKNGYSHTAILANAVKSKVLKPEWMTLRAKNSVIYAGQTLEFRKNNPRNFEFNGAKYESLVLVDDIVTTGSTLLEAKNKVECSGRHEALFAITLADAKE